MVIHYDYIYITYVFMYTVTSVAAWAVVVWIVFGQLCTNQLTKQGCLMPYPGWHQNFVASGSLAPRVYTMHLHLREWCQSGVTSVTSWSYIRRGNCF